jgi:transcriptional regulator with XRE-family HTH domain
MSNRKNWKQKYEKLMVLIGDRIREVRKERGYTNADRIAYESALGRQQWNRYELGDDLNFSTLLHVLASLKIDFNEFFTDELNQAIKEYMSKE